MYRTHSSIDFKKLADTRLQIHLAVQYMSAAARAYLKKENDDSHTSMTFSGGSFVAKKMGDLQFSFDVPTASAIANYSGKEVKFAISGGTAGDVMGWAVEQAKAAGHDPKKLDFKMPYELPKHKVSQEAKFEVDLDMAKELSDYFNNGFYILNEISKMTNGSPPICWPHHFDVASLIAVGKNAKGEDKTIGLGLSPGDEHYTEPYYYVTPWPKPKVNDLPPLALGNWHTKDFTAAVLKASELIDNPPQPEALQGFLATGIMGSKQLLVS